MKTGDLEKLQWAQLFAEKNNCVVIDKKVHLELIRDALKYRAGYAKGSYYCGPEDQENLAVFTNKIGEIN